MIINFSQKSLEYWIKFKDYFSFSSIEKFKNYFFDDLDIEFVEQIVCADNLDKVDGTLYNIQDDNNFSDNKLNILLCVENCYYWKHYLHYNKYSNYNNDKIQIYLYNHIDKIERSDTYISIPVIYLQMNYLKKYYDIIKPSIQTEFEKKKNCLIATSINNIDKKNISNILHCLFNKCDFISDKKDLVGSKSCYNDIELLNLFNEYKYVFVAENSVIDGYITEKIFNCYLARTIPIYFGSKKITKYFNEDTFININDYNNIPNIIDKIKKINNQENYDKIINSEIINKNYDDENYKFILNNFIKNNLKKKNI
jgi:hypothetical protein